MRFRKTMTSMGTMKKDDFYDFKITKMQENEARKRDFENPLILWENGSVLILYSEKEELRLQYFISYYGFKEGLGEHTAKEFDNVVSCSCGKRFPQGVKKLGMDNFNKHFQEIEKLKEEDAKSVEGEESG